MEEYFYAKIDDMVRKSERYIGSCSAFMNPDEQYHADKYLKSTYGEAEYFFDGGYPEAERKVLYFRGCFNVSALRISAGNYDELTHRDYMGALLSLGIERSSLGDIAIQDKSTAVIFVLAPIAEFLLGIDEPLERIGRAKVRTELFAVPSDFCGGARFIDINDTVASARLDCIVAALADISRDKAKNLVASGSVQLNFTEALKADAEVSSDDVVSVRGCGRFKIKSIDEDNKTRKGRIRLSALKYI